MKEAGARAYFINQIRTLLDSDEQDSSEIIGEARFNIYATYWKDRNYAKAKETLEEIQLVNPTYEPQLVAEDLKINEQVIW